MKSILIAFSMTLFCLIARSLGAQDLNRTDSLDVLLSKTPDPRAKVDLILQYLNKPENLYLEHAGKLAKRALEISTRCHYEAGKINSMLKLGNYYYRSSDYKQSMEFAQRSKELSEDLSYSKELANSLTLIGMIYMEIGDFDKSSQYFFRSLKLSESLQDKEGIARSMSDIGNNFCSQADYKKALEYFQHSLVLAQEIHSPVLIKRQYNNMAVVYGDLGKYDTAEIFLRKALEISKQLGDKLGQGINIMNIGYGQMNTGKFEKALASFQESLLLFTELNNRLHMAKCYVNLGFCNYTSGRVDSSIRFFKIALREGQAQRYFLIINSAAAILNKIYEEKHDTLAAHPYLALEKSSGDSIYASQKQKLSSKLELQYLYEKDELQRKLNQQARNILMIFIIFSLVSGIVILILLLSRYRLKSRNVILEKEKIESELSIKNKELTVNLIALIKKNEMLSSISDQLIRLERETKGTEAKDVITQLSQILRTSTDNKMLSEFSARFQEIHAGFYEKLLKSYPDLTQNELKLCAFLRLNMTTKDISELTGQILPSIDQARYRLRKKLGIANSETNLVTFLSQI